MEMKKAWSNYTLKETKELEALNESYRAFLTESKTERRCVTNTVLLLEAAGYKNLDSLIKSGKKLKKGDKVYAVGMKKTVAAFYIGTEPMEKGMNILGAHIDSPRLDVKQVPLYEDDRTNFVYLDTHYYGGIKKYQWVALPLALYGVIVKKDGTVVEVAIGDRDTDPVFGITDLLPHLAQDQMKGDAAHIITAENLDLLIGSKPKAETDKKGKETDKESTKSAILKILKERYEIEEDDFLSAELEIVPAGKARNFGLDESMVIGYGQDDRVCAYTSLMAILDTKTPKRTSVCLLTDKEEIGSVGATGAQSRFFENSVAEIMHLLGKGSDIQVRRALKNSKMLSSDVSAAYDPLFASVNEPKNAAYFGCGVCFNKFTGRGGKGGSNDANAEYIAHVRNVLDKNKVRFQTAELGKVDQGGGGTIAYISALYGMEVIDSGVAVLSMHAPWEICSKSDIYEAYKAYKAFLEDA